LILYLRQSVINEAIRKNCLTQRTLYENEVDWIGSFGRSIGNASRLG
jgi:hypothetical protein